MQEKFSYSKKCNKCTAYIQYNTTQLFFMNILQKKNVIAIHSKKYSM